MRRSVRSLGRLRPFARTLETCRLVGPKRMGRDPLRLRWRRSGPSDAHSHTGAQIRETGTRELGYHIVTIAGRIHGGADFHHLRVQQPIGAAQENQVHGRAERRAWVCQFGNLKLNLKRIELAHSKTLVALDDGLTFSNVAPRYDAGKWSA